jgi:ABC-type polysaccharide/polyol phosphate export permease
MKTLVADVREMMAEQVQYRELLYQMTRRDLLIRYKQTIMGFGWAIFVPLINTIVFSVVFVKVAPLDVGAPYPVFAYVGLLAWNLTASALRLSAGSLITNINLVTKVYFPREIFPFAVLIAAAVDFGVGASLLAALMMYYQVPVGPTLLFVPVVLAVQVMFTGGVALMLAMANLFWRDVKYLFEVVIMVWMFASSVLYPLDRVGGLAGTLLRANPMTLIIDGYRAILFRGELPAAAPFAAVTAVSLMVLGVGWLVFHRNEYRFAELL